MITFASRYYPKIAQRFLADAAEHEMTVMHDDGIYRHLRFKAPGTGIYRFDIVTWPGYLSITGDVAAFTFTRLEDMFEFFAAGIDINPGYWAEKLVAVDARAYKPGARVYSPSMFRRHVADLVREHITDEDLTRDAARDLWQAVSTELFDVSEYEETARPALNAFEHAGFTFSDTWEWDLRDWTWSYLWSCCAIRWGITQYQSAVSRPLVGAL